MIAMALLLLALPDPPPTVTAVRLEAEGGRPLVRVAVSGAVAARVDREGRDLVLVFPGAHLAPGLVLPGPLAEIQSFRGEETRDGARVRVRVDGPFDYDLTQEGGVVSVALRPRGASPLPSPSPAARRTADDVRALYAKIAPPAAEPGRGEPPSNPAAPTDVPEQDGFQFGHTRVRPSVGLTYVDADIAFLDTPEPVRDQYFQIEPHLPVDVGATGAGRPHFRVSYDPRFRFGSQFEELRQPTHMINAGLDVPVGATTALRAGYHFAHGLLETTEVDPGREYFFQLAPYTHQQEQVGLSFNQDGLLGLDVVGTHDSIDVDEESGFFDHSVDTVGATLNYGFGATAHAFLRYQWERVPTPPERPEAESRSNTITAGVSGELLPLVTGEVSGGVRVLDAPNGGAGGQRYVGSVLALSLRKAFSPTSSLTLLARRDTFPSAFEENAFYVATGVGAEADFGLPLSVVFHGAVGFQRNSYRVASTEDGVPRRDDIVAWAVGIGRGLTRWSYLRADYRQDRRTSNLPAYDSHGHIFTVQLGLGYLGSTPAGGVPR